MSITPIQAPPLASLGIDVPPSLRDSSSSAVSEIASSCLMAPTTLTPLSLSGRIAAVPPPFPLGLSPLGMTDQSAPTPHSVGERQTPLPLELPGLDPLPAQNLPAAAAGPHTFDADMDLGDRQAATPHEHPVSSLPAAPPQPKRHLEDQPAWGAVDTSKYTRKELEKIGKLTIGSRKIISWKCTNKGCPHKWQATVHSRHRAQHSTTCTSCSNSSRPRLQEHEAWEAVDTSEYTKEELEEIGNLTQGSEKLVSWRCTTPGCGKKWKSSVLVRGRAKYPVMCNSCTKRGSERPQQREDKESRAFQKRHKSIEEQPMSSTPTQGPSTSLCANVPPTLWDSRAVSETASSRLQAPTSLTPPPLSGSPELPDLNPMPAQHSIGEMDFWDEDAVANLTLTSAQPVQNSPAAAAPNPHASGVASQPLKATPSPPKRYLKGHPAWEAVDTSKYTRKELGKIGNFTQSSERLVSWKCQRVGCANVWEGPVKGRCQARLPTACLDCSRVSKPLLRAHEAWAALHKKAYKPQELAEIGRLTQGSERKVKWICQRVGCVNVWEGTVKNRCHAKAPTACVSCANARKGRACSKKDNLRDHPAWEAVDTSEYTREELEKIGDLTLGSDTSVSWRCTAPDCGKKWKSPVLVRGRAKYPVICNSCTKRGTKRVQKKPEDKGSRTGTKRSRTTKE